MKISIIAPDLSHNCLGRAYILAKILQRRYEVEIVGPMLGEEIWKPVANDMSIQYKSVKFCKKFISIPRLKELYDKIDGDVIYATKPLFNSFTLGLVKKIFTKKPLILDIDDWELGFSIGYYKSMSIINKLFYILKEPFRFLLKPNESLVWKIINEKFTKFANAITVSSSFLKKRFGGIILYHARDVDWLNPRMFNKQLLRQKYGLDEKSKVIMFFGTPRPYKGLEDLIDAVFLIRDEDVLLVIVGIDDKDQYCKHLVNIAEKKLSSRIKVFGLQSFEKIPEFLSIADVIVIPQRRDYSTIGQVPAKVFDAMAMAKPIIATNVSDLPEILSGCGWILKPGDLKQLSEIIKYVLSNLQKAKEFGLRAREKCITNYSYNAVEKSLVSIFKKYE